jgi:hypothetical protein
MTKSNKKSENLPKCSVKKTIIKKQKAITATSIVKPTIEKRNYCRAQEWIHDNAMPWVESEKIKLESEKDRALLKEEIDSIKQMQFIIEKLVDVDQFGDTVKWKNYPCKYNSVYDGQIKILIFILRNYSMMKYHFINYQFLDVNDILSSLNDYNCFLLEDSAWDRAASHDGKLGVKVNFDNIYMDSVKPWTLHIIAYNLYQDQKYAYLNEFFIQRKNSCALS